ncbi:MAG: hypothetical protein RLZZ303_2257, partial [Candidatus Hydrogenedentota bacterium]
IIIVDDGSTDRTAEIAHGYEGITYIRQDNAGPAAARNRGAAAAKGEWLAFTDSDCIAEPDWISALMAKVRANEGKGVVGVGGTYGIANPESLLARIIHAEIQARHARMKDEVDFLGSFNVAYERKAFEAVGGFDESFSQASAEDNDLAYRLIDAGGKLLFSKLAVVNHYHPTRLLPYFKTQMRHGFWRVRLYQKHPEWQKGDSYAGKGELASSGVLLGFGGGLIIITLTTLWLGKEVDWGLVFGMLTGLLLLSFFQMAGIALRIHRYVDGTGALLYPVIGVSRDFPRAAGLAWGTLHFYLLRKTIV